MNFIAFTGCGVALRLSINLYPAQSARKDIQPCNPSPYAPFRSQSRSQELRSSHTLLDLSIVLDRWIGQEVEATDALSGPSAQGSSSGKVGAGVSATFGRVAGIGFVIGSSVSAPATDGELDATASPGMALLKGIALGFS